jgi:FkbH-like protein
MTAHDSSSVEISPIRTPIKCVVWDLDNTLWSGILSEGDEIILRPWVKETIVELDRRGILQSVASKNDFDLAWKKLEDFELRDFFLCPQIGWGSKADSVKAISESLGISLDAFAFVDDQAHERAEVEYFHPMTMTIDAADAATILKLPQMQPRFVTAESRIRRAMYQADFGRKNFEAGFAGSKQEFLATLGLRITICRATEEYLRRAEELTIRSHQLNATGKTYSYDELHWLMRSPEHLLLVARLEDRFGSSGTIGLALVEKSSGIGCLKLLIVSCRVKSCGVGGILLSYILRYAKREGMRLRAEFVKTERNRMMYLTYKFHGFNDVEMRGDVEILDHDLDEIRPFPDWATVLSPGLGEASEAPIAY